MSGAEQILIIGMDGVPIGDITVEKDAVELTAADYIVVIPKAQVATIIDTSFYTAIRMESLVETTDIMNSPEGGGPGTRNKVNEVDCFVVNSVGGELSADGGETFEAIKQTSGQTISFKNGTPYNQILAALAMKSQRYSE